LDHVDHPEPPYVYAVMKESLRWHAATPQGKFLCLSFALFN
jgi:hypothetical protein